LSAYKYRIINGYLLQVFFHHQFIVESAVYPQSLFNASADLESIFAVKVKLLLKQEALRILQGTPFALTDLVFAREDGSPLRPNAVTSAWIRLAKRAGLHDIRLHDARHTHASLMLKQGIHPKIVQERLGHSSIAITLDTYSHVIPGLQEAAAKRFDEVITRTSLLSL
jgi:integrase